MDAIKMQKLVDMAVSEGLEIRPGKIVIVIPDMFAAFIAESPAVNPHYVEVKVEGEKWIFDALGANAKLRHQISGCDFTLFQAICAPEASMEEFRTMCDWGNWVFPFDDLFDNGHLKDDRVGSQRLLNSLLRVIREDLKDSALIHTPTYWGRIVNVFWDSWSYIGGYFTDPLVKVHNSVWKRIVEIAPLDVQKRFADSMEVYAAGVLKHVGDLSEKNNPSIEQFMEARRGGVGVTPVIALVEYAHRFHVPDYIYEHESMVELRRATTDVIIIQNDIISYRKEEREDVAHNLIKIFQRMGATKQQAFDKAGDMLQACYRDWDIAKKSMPACDDELSRSAVEKYLEAMKCTMAANLHWQFKSERYLGEIKHLALRFRTITVNAD